MGLLRVGVPTVGAIPVSMMGGGCPSVGIVDICYLLQATFNAPNQGFVDGQVLDTEAEGVQVGQLTVAEVDGTLAIAGNTCSFTAQGTPVWTDLGFVGEQLGGGGFARELGRTLLVTFNLSTWEEMGFGWHFAANVVDPDNMPHAIQANTVNGRLDKEGGVQIWDGLAQNTEYEWAIVLGGYNAAGEAWYLGQAAANYEYGASQYFYDGANWNLAWRDMANDSATMYPVASMFDAVGTIELPSGVPCDELTAVLQPLVFDAFSDVNGTSLDVHIPDVDDVGGGWTEQSGDWDIQGNRGHNTGVDPGTWIASLDAGEADVWARTIINMSGVTANGAIMLRYSDNSNYWFVGLGAGANEIQIWEVNGGVATRRAWTAIALNPGIDYDSVAIADAQDITGFVDGGSRVTYGAAALNENATIHGLRPNTVDCEYDNFHIHSRRSAIYDATFGAY